MTEEERERNNVLYNWIKPNMTTNTYYFGNKAIEKSLKKKNIFKKIINFIKNF